MNRPDLLEAMAVRSAQRAGELRATADELRARARTVPPATGLNLSGFDLIGEIKPASPSEGALADCDPMEAARRARVYEAAGVAAISVLTEPTRFGGSLEHLAAVAASVRVPVMRKDFLVDPLQVVEARAHGASGVLVVVRMVDDATLGALVRCAGEYGMFALLEAFSKEDLARIRALTRRGGETQVLVGVNARDLTTLEVVPERQRELARSLPPGVPAVAESGLCRGPDARVVARSGYRLALVGSALMRAADPRALARELLSAGRAAVDGAFPQRAAEEPSVAERRAPFVKLCGLRTAEDVAAAVRAGADAVGFVLAPSPRRVTREGAAELLKRVPAGILRVAVMGRPTPAEVATANSLPFDALQCEVEGEGGKIVLPRLEGGRCLLPSFRDGAGLEQRVESLLSVRAEDAEGPGGPGTVLIDGPRGGGRGVPADLERVRRVADRVPVILAGGLTPQTVRPALEAVGAFGVDVSSGIERAPGVKDAERMARFAAAARGVSEPSEPERCGR